MTTLLIFVAVLVGYALIRFMMDMNKDNYDLENQNLAEKFEVVVGRLNEAAYGGMASVTVLDKRSFNLYHSGSNQIINFQYSTGHLTITWRYKVLQKEVVHSKQFTDVRNLSIIEQGFIADQMLEEMEEVVGRHQMDVMTLR